MASNVLLYSIHVLCVFICVQVISAALSQLTPGRANLLLLSPENEGQCPLREKWFGTSYNKEGTTQTNQCIGCCSCFLKSTSAQFVVATNCLHLLVSKSVHPLSVPADPTQVG